VNKKKRRPPEGHLYSFPFVVRDWMLQHASGHLHGEEILYCGDTRGSFVIEGRPPKTCRLCDCALERGSWKPVEGGYFMWHRTAA